MRIEEVRNRLTAGLAGREIGIQNEADYFPGAVVVPLLPEGDELAVLFEVRSAKLGWQPGEVCFPGGRIEPTDASPSEAAIRETYEELGIAHGSLELLGALDYMVSPIGVLLHPFAGYISRPETIRPNQDEVQETFTVPLGFLLNTEPLTAQMEVATRPLPGFPMQLLPEGYSDEWRRRATYPVLFYEYQGRVIWGITARVLYDFVLFGRKVLK